MLPALSPVRFPLMALGLLALLAALWGGLMRLGWPLALLGPHLPAIHGPLMICGFLGTLIGVERAVALGLRWPYVAPICTALGALALLGGQPAAPLMALGSLGLVAIFGVIVHRQRTLANVMMALGAILWGVGNGFWLAGWSFAYVVPWWSGFLVLTIAGERLELSRILRLSTTVHLLFVLAVGLLLSGLLLLPSAYDFGIRLTGIGMLAVAVWLWRYDLARRTVRQQGLTRFMAVCLLSGYGWLGIGGGLAWRFGGVMAGPYYDAMLHTVFVGFVVAMLFGHAPMILPAILGRIGAPYHPAFYGPLVLLHASLLLRILGDLAGWWPGRLWGGLLNTVTILLFFVTLARMLPGRQP